MTTAEIKNLIVKYAKENNASMVAVGIRSLNDSEHYEVGDIAEASYEWDLEADCSTFYTTKLLCDGTCASGSYVDSTDDEDLEEAIEKMIKYNASYSPNRQVLLISETEGDYGTRDDGEVRIVNAEVIAHL